MFKYVFVFMMMALPVFASEIPTNKVVLRGVDKITGRVSTMQANVGDEVPFGDLKIIVSKCFTRPPEEMPENSAYLTVTHTQPDGSVSEVFNGWMFSSNPALSAMEHPVYDVWVLSCTNTFKKNVKTLSETAASENMNVADTEAVAEDDNPALGED